MIKKRFKVEKLIRDKSIERMKKQNITCQSRVLNEEEYAIALKNKLEEETAEVLEAVTREEIIDEMADVLEVLHALAQSQQSSMEEVEKLRAEKYVARGGFDQRIYGEYIEMAADNPKAEEFQNQPHKYPEI